jgi:hypothetical protein
MPPAHRIIERTSAALGTQAVRRASSSSRRAVPAALAAAPGGCEADLLMTSLLGTTRPGRNSSKAKTVRRFSHETNSRYRWPGPSFE